MRTSARGISVTALTATAVLALTTAFTTAATADQDNPTPTQQQVDHAKAVARSKAGDVSRIEARLAAANQRLEAAATRAEIASERYNGARWQLQQARAQVTATARAAQAAAARVQAERTGIASLVTQTYQDGAALNAVTAFLGSGGPHSVMEKYGVAASAHRSMQARYAQFGQLSEAAAKARKAAERAAARQAVLTADAARARQQATVAADAAQAEESRIAATKRRLITQLAQAQHLSVQLVRQRQSALEQAAQEQAAEQAAEQAQQQAAAAAAAAAAKPDPKPDPAPEQGGDPAPAPDPDPAPDPGPPSPSGGASAAIAFAKAQLGEPYVWGADGPSSWDCSGLTMRAWEQGGISLPHWSVGQYYESTPISVSQLRPGDLVFWSDNGSPSGIHHVAMYIGDGQIIHAPRTGRPVEIDSMYYWIPPDYFARP